MKPLSDLPIRHRRRVAGGLALAAAVAMIASAMAVPAGQAGRWPSAVLELPDSLPSLFIAETDATRIRRFDRAPDGLVTGHDTTMSIGENGAGKRRAWDRKTPLGIYFVVDDLDTSRLHDKYGVRAFPLDYPNTLDRLEGRTGDGIWVHGVEPGGGTRPPLDTDGCLALPNEDLATIATSFVPNRTPVIVTRAMSWRDDAERQALVRQLRHALAEWEQAQETGQAERYLSLYHDDFEYRGLARDEWTALRRNVLARHDNIAIEVDDLLLLADPTQEGLYLSRFRHTVTQDDEKTITTKRLYWQQQADGNLKIIAEDNG